MLHPVQFVQNPLVDVFYAGDFLRPWYTSDVRMFFLASLAHTSLLKWDACQACSAWLWCLLMTRRIFQGGANWSIRCKVFQDLFSLRC
jgi:hypothetical protein